MMTKAVNMVNKMVSLFFSGPGKHKLAHCVHLFATFTVTTHLLILRLSGQEDRIHQILRPLESSNHNLILAQILSFVCKIIGHQSTARWDS